MAGFYALVWGIQVCLPHPRSLSSSWAIPTFNRLPFVVLLLDDCQGIVGHREGDFDFHPFLSRLFPSVINTTSCLSLADPDTRLFSALLREIPCYNLPETFI